VTEVLRILLQALVSLALYAFLGILLFTLWRDIQESRLSVSNRGSAYLQIHVEGRRSWTQELEIINLIGRAQDNTIMLDDETVSTHHARLSYQEDRWWLEDLGSKNGTRVNDIALEHPLVVTSGDLIQLGAVRLRLRIGVSGLDLNRDSGA
jgi:hypothetical protein